jgi:hypothetical protein
LPIADCFLSGELPADADVEGLLVALYRLMALLFLPSVWSPEAVGRLRVAARGLGRRYRAPA